MEFPLPTWLIASFGRPIAGKWMACLSQGEYATTSADPIAQTPDQRRRTERILLRIPIEARGTAADGKPFTEKTHTLAINRDGARIAAVSPLVVGAKITLTNLQNNMTAPFRVVIRIEKSLSGNPEWGVECLEPQLNFWGIFFPEKTPGTAKDELIDVLLECSRCHTRELAQLTLKDYQTILTQPSLERECKSCRAATRWTFGLVEGDKRGKTPPAAARDASPQSAERRRANRVTVELPVRIRLEEIGRTENLSTTGVCFSSTLGMKVGDCVRLTVGYTPGGNDKEVSARVVWKQEREGGNCFLYGVELQEDS